MKTFRKIHGFLSGEMPIIEMSLYEFVGAFLAAYFLLLICGLLLFILPCLSGGCT